MNVQEILKSPLAQPLKERFLRYVKICSQSDSSKADSGIQPSTECQWDMANLLSDELKALGLKDVQTTEHCYTYGRLSASPGMEGLPSICLLSHIDTVEEVSGKDVNPIIHENYDGKAIKLPYGNVLDPKEDKALAQAGREGDTIITSDGNTLLGADDKAGVSEIMTALEYFVSHPEEKHGDIEVIFSPDEETGHGMDNVPLNLLKSKCAYTVDGGHIGELETECFNAYKSDLVFTGKALHTGTARPNMINAINMLSSFVQLLPHHQMPETTDGRMGFYAPMEISGGMEKARITLFLRDFEDEGMKKRLSLVEELAEATANSYGGKVEVKHTRQYINMKGILDQHPMVAQKLVQAYKNAGIEPVFPAIRGGTDGSRLTEMGIPTPNIFTGGHNFHSRSEWASLSQMVSAVKVLIQLTLQWTKK
ncbi:MAG: peptidase T [Treponema sp.]|nr:peptidase T [Treponema sp.]